MRSVSAALNALRTINEQDASKDPVLLMTSRTLASFQVFIILPDSVQILLESMDSKNIEIFLSGKS